MNRKPMMHIGMM